MSGERVFGFSRRFLAWMSAAFLLSAVAIRYMGFLSSEPNLQHGATSTRAAKRAMKRKGEHVLMRWQLELANGAAPTDADVVQIVASVKRRLQYGGHRDMDVRVQPPNAFTVEVLPNSDLSRDRVEQRLRMRGIVRLTPLASSLIGREHQVVEGATEVQLRTPPNHLFDFEIKGGGLIVTRVDDARDGDLVVLGYESKNLITNDDFFSVSTELSSQPTLSDIVLSLNDRGMAKKNRYPRLYTVYRSTGDCCALTGFVLDNWLVSTIDVVGMAWPNEVQVPLPFPFEDAEDLAAAISFPWPSHVAAVILSNQPEELIPVP